MSVDILQGPTTPNVTKTNLVYTLSSSNASNPQFRYVTDIYESGTGDYVTTIKTYPNLSGNSILDLSRTLDDQLDYDQYWKITGSIAPVESVKTFNIIFGEEYAPSYSGSITLYTGSSAYNLEVFPGEVYKNEGSYNFNTSSVERGILSNAPVGENWNPATTDPNLQNINLVLGLDDYHTITLLDADTDISVSWSAKDGTFIGFQVINSASSSFSTLGIGPANLIDLNPANAAYFDTADYVAIENIGSTPLGGSYRYAIKNRDLDPYCQDEYTRFAFINQYGFWDYYNVYNPLRSNNQVDRSLYDRTFVRYEDTLGNYDISNRGTTQYRTEYSKEYIITTDYIDKENSQWLTELFESPEVFIQSGSDFIPINITNTNIRWNMNQYRQKLFQYDIEFKYANQPQPR